MEKNQIDRENTTDGYRFGSSASGRTIAQVVATLQDAIDAASAASSLRAPAAFTG